MSKITFRDTLSQEIVQLTQQCDFFCSFCPLWQDEAPETLPIVKSLRSKQLFKQISFKKRLYNIVGGDPFKEKKLRDLLIYLKKYNKKVRLWTHAAVDINRWDSILPYINEVMLYVPVSEPQEYEDITGKNVIGMVETIIPYLKSYGVSVRVQTPVNKIYLDRLPDIYTWVHSLKVPWLLHYQKNDVRSSEVVNMIRHFRKERNVEVFENRFLINRQCHALSHAYMTDVYQQIRSAFERAIKARFSDLL